MTKSLAETIRSVLSEDTANAATLKPGSKSKAPPQKLEGEVKDLGGPVVKNDQASVPADKTTESISKSKEPGATPPVKGEPMKKLHEALAELGVEMTEEVESAIAEMVEDGLTEDEIIEVVTESVLSEEKEEDEDDDKDDDSDKDEDDDKDVKEEKEPFKFSIDVSAHTKAMFEGQELSEDFKKKATTIFEAAVIETLNTYKTKLDEEFEVIVAESVAEIKEDMEAKVKSYMDFVAEEWIKDNEVAIESSLRTELTEDFIAGLRNLFIENYIDIPEDKVDVVGDMANRVAEIEDRLNESIKAVKDLKEANVVLVKQALVNEAVVGLTATHAEKVKSLAEGLEFVSEADFKDKVKTLIEGYASGATPVKKDTSLIAEISPEPEKSIVEDTKNDVMSIYAAAISKTVK